jgi:hypothetical protein
LTPDLTHARPKAMSISTFFLEALGSYLIQRAAQPGLDYTLQVLDDELHKLTAPAPPREWKLGPLTPEQQEFVSMVPTLQDVSVLSHIRSWLRRAPKRGIILLGPSGAGKSQLDLRLRGKAPQEDILYTADDETRRLVLQGRRVPLLDTPGAQDHARLGYGDALEAMLRVEPPSVAIIAVAGGYLATSMPDLRATFVRPSSGGRTVASSTTKFIEHCCEEEAGYVREFVQQCRAHAKTNRIEPMPRQRLRAVITVLNKRDLWGANAESAAQTIAYYQDPSSPYGAALQEFRDAFGAPDQHSHDVLPMFTHGSGFHPDSTVAARALTPFDSAIDALLLRTLVSYRYTGGGRIP